MEERASAFSSLFLCRPQTLFKRRKTIMAKPIAGIKPIEWAKHLRKKGKRIANKKVRKDKSWKY
tara:strand:- start:22 stop:213 length:192 start_codon:yes stop_codon:yes gene_type:complete